MDLQSIRERVLLVLKLYDKIDPQKVVRRTPSWPHQDATSFIFVELRYYAKF